MPSGYYSEARKLGLKEVNRSLMAGKSPYLPVMEDFLSTERMNMGKDAGYFSIPLWHVVGNRLRGREKAFAANFMPVLPEDSEFALKWKALCQAHLEEGIRDPILVYEFMNRFYVEEGNKRVSVLKFFDAVSVQAHVMRIMPENRDDPDVKLYLEFLDFFKRSGVNTIEFVHPGAYGELEKLMGKEDGAFWTEDERLKFNSRYTNFRRAYEANGGMKLSCPVSDAFLAYLRLMGYDSLEVKSFDEMKKQVSSAWEDITLQQNDELIEVKSNPGPTDKDGGSILKKIIQISRPRIVKAAFLYDKTPETSGWALRHERGRKAVEEALLGRVETSAYEDVMSDPEGFIQKAIDDGNTCIFTTSPRMLKASLSLAVEHPEVSILNCSLNTAHRYISTYYARMYEAKFVLGAMAASLAGSNKIGYVCDYPIYGQISGINAFALGAELVNPRIKVYLEWSSTDGLKAAERRLLQEDIHVISYLDTPEMIPGGVTNFGLNYKESEESEAKLLAVPVWRWGNYYEILLKRIMDKSYHEEYHASTKALNYYWGMSANVIDLSFTEDIPDGTKKLGQILKDSIRNGHLEPFSGLIESQDGLVTSKNGERLRMEEIVDMDYLVKNIVGVIPPYHTLNDIAKSTVEVSGVSGGGNIAGRRPQKEDVKKEDDKDTVADETKEAMETGFEGAKEDSVETIKVATPSEGVAKKDEIAPEDASPEIKEAQETKAEVDALKVVAARLEKGALEPGTALMETEADGENTQEKV